MGKMVVSNDLFEVKNCYSESKIAILVKIVIFDPNREQFRNK